MSRRSKTVFIAYAHKDYYWKDKASNHLSVLSSSLQLEVWSDNDIGAGQDWLKEIEAAIAQASVAILLISSNFLTSDFINRKEVPNLLSRKSTDGLPIIPILIRECSWKHVSWLNKLQLRPFDAKAIASSGKKSDAYLSEIANEVALILKQTAPTKKSDMLKKPKSSNTKKKAPILVSSLPAPENDHITRLDTLPIGGLPLPCFFPSISGAAKSNFSPLDHLQILVKLKHPSFLISAYDFVKISRAEKIHRTDRLKMLSLIEDASNNGQVILLDSGLYERKWLHDTTWSRQSFHAALSGIRCHLGFFFDNIHIKASASLRESASTISSKVKGDRRSADLEALFPIVHPRKSGDPTSLPDLCRLVAQYLDSDIIAVAERELGDGILEGAKTMLSIRSALNKTGQYRVIHVLGTGNPLSILIYAACGADSFDGLDWCQTVVNYQNKNLYHNLQIDFFRDQSGFAADTNLGHPTRMLAHNLLFYRKWMSEIQEHLASGTLPTLLKKVLPPHFFNDLMTLLKAENIEEKP